MTKADRGRLDEASGQFIELGRAARQDDPRHWRALLACIFAIVATAIDPPILQATSSGVQGALRVEPVTAAQLVSLYYMIQAGVMVAGGVLGDLFGLRRVLLLGLAGMLVTSIVTAAAPTFGVLLIGHVGLSLFTAVVVPLSLAGVMRTFGQRVLPVAIAVYLTIQLLAALAGPALAQLLFDRAGFAATLVPAILATFLAIIGIRRWLPAPPPGKGMSRLDALSLTLWSVGMFALVYGTVAFATGWGEYHELAIIGGIVVLIIGVARLARGTTRIHLPQVPFRVVGVTLYLGAMLGIAQSGTLLQISTFLKGVQGYGGLASGIALAPFAIAILVASIATGIALTRRYRGTVIEMRVFRRPIAVGFALVSISAFLMGLLKEDSGYLLIGTALGLLGTGAAIANVPRTDLLFRSVRDDRVGVAAGLNGSSFLLGEALGNVAVTTMIALTGAVAWQQQLVQSGMTADEAASAYRTVQQAAFLATAHPFVQPSLLDVAQLLPGWQAVFTAGFTGAMIVVGILAAIAAMVAVAGLRDAPGPTSD